MIPQTGERRRWGRAVLIIALCGAAGVGLRLTVFRARPVPVTVHRVGTGRVEDTVVNSRAGTVESRRRAGMSPGIPGLVRHVAVRKGSRVKQGDLLLQLDDSEHQAQAQLARRALEAAQAMAEQARLEAELAGRHRKRTEALARDQVVSETALDLDETRARVAEAVQGAAAARVREAEAALDTAAATLAKTTMAAPFDGVVLDVTAEVGEWISPAPPGVFIPPVIDLIDPAALYVSAPIDEADVARLRVGLPVRITLDAFRGDALAGSVVHLSSYVETREDQNRTLRIEAAFEDGALPVNLLPGLSADLEVILAARAPVVRVPTYAVLEGGQVLVAEQGRLVRRPVTTGLRNWSFTEISAGLAAGELVVVSLDRPEVVAGARVDARLEGEP